MSNGQEIQLLDVRKHKEILTRPQQLEALDKWCGGGDLRAEALVRYALAEMETNGDLLQCTPTSIYLALLACGVTRLVPGKLRGFSFLVPFGNKKKIGEGKDTKEIVVQEATFMMGWRGVKHIGFRSGLDLVSAVIHENDLFDYDKGTSAFVKYKQAFKNPGAVIGAAAWVQLPRGGIEIEFMNSVDLEKVKQAATRIRKSPAWEGPFRDQMERKTALKRLGKQIDSGEEFFKADALDMAANDGHVAAQLDEFTDGTATRFLGERSAEAAAFEHLPRPAQVQVGAQVGTTNTGAPVHAAGAGVPPRASNKGSRPRVVEAQSSERPTTGSSGQQTSSSGATAQASSAGSPAGQPSSSKPAAASSSATGAGAGAASGSPTGPTPATSNAGSTSSPASAASPAATSAGSPTSAPTDSTDSASDGSTESSADGQEFGQSPSQSDEMGDVAGEPGPDGDFDLAFGEDPVDAEPAAVPTREELLGHFVAWAEAHNTRELVAGDASWKELVTAWLLSCQSNAEIEQHKPVFTQWSMKVFSKGRAADPKKNIAAMPPDEGVTWLQRAFGERIKQVPQ